MTNAPDNDDDLDTSAADEPTAMWGADALKELGLEEAAKAHEEPSVVAPAAQARKPQPAASARPATKPKTIPKKRPAAPAGPSWTTTIVLAIAVAAGVFFGVRAILG